MKLFLASASERRKELLGWLGVPFEVRESGFDEQGIGADDVRALVGALALAKAQTVADKLKAELSPAPSLEKEMSPRKIDPIYVLGGDTLVYFEGEIIGKPRDLDHAREILTSLRGKTHEVYSGVALVDVLTGKQKVLTDQTEVKFKNFSDGELENYLSTSEPLGKAGAYMILGEGKVLVENVSGSVTNVTGLPLMRVVDLLGKFEIPVEVDVAKTIMDKTGYSS